MPGIQTADRKAGHQQRQRPGMASRMALSSQMTQRRAEQRRNRHRPADQPHHAQAKPDAGRGVAPRLELARRLRADLPTEGRLRALISVFFVTHDETPRSGGENRFHFRHHRAHALLPFVQVQKLPLHRIAQLAEVRSANRVAHGNEHVRAGLDQHPFIHGHVDLALALRFRRSESRARAPRRSRVGVARVRTNPRASPQRCATRRFSRRRPKRQENLKIHERRLHVRPPLRFSGWRFGRFGLWLWPWIHLCSGCQGLSASSWLRF
jgi:hypothetical protein